MALTKSELAKLAPEERIIRLKELGELRKKELEETQDLIKKTEAELSRPHIPNIEIPHIEPIDISRIFKIEEGLETTVKQEEAEKEQTRITYISSASYTNETLVHYGAGDSGIQADIHRKFEDSIKYESEADKNSEGAASRSVLKNIKKYSSG